MYFNTLRYILFTMISKACFGLYSGHLQGNGIFVNCNWVDTLWQWGTAVAQWLRCCATNRKVAGSIPAGVIGIFH